MANEWMNFFEIIGPAPQINDLYQTLENNLQQENEEVYFNVQKWDIDQAEIVTEMLRPTIKLVQPLQAPQPLKNGKVYLALKFISYNSLPRENFLTALSQKYQGLILARSYDWDNLDTLFTQLADSNFRDYYECDFNDTFIAKDRELIAAKEEAGTLEDAVRDQWTKATIAAIETELEKNLDWLLEDYYVVCKNPIIYPKAQDFVQKQIKER